MTETPFLRPVRLPQGIAGELWLGPMPGRRRPFGDDMDDLRARNITRIVSLTPLAEIEEKAPSYAIALGGEINIAIVRFPIADFGIPADEAALFALADEAAQHLSGGGNVFVPVRPVSAALAPLPSASCEPSASRRWRPRPLSPAPGPDRRPTRRRLW
jgi:hypothetical protein